MNTDTSSENADQPIPPTAVICWEATTGARGYGQPIPRHAAEAWIVELKKIHPDMSHWLVPAVAPKEGTR